MSTEATEVVESMAGILSRESPSDPETGTDAKPAADKSAAAAAPSAAKAETADTKPDADAQAKQQAEEKAKQERDEKGRFTKAEDEIKGIQAALKEERRKRQDLERKLKAAPEPAAKKEDFFANPEAALEARDQRLRAEADERFFRMCERQAKGKHEDYESIVAELMEAAEEDRALAVSTFNGMRESDDPAEFLYKAARSRHELKSVNGDLGKYRETIEAPLKGETAKLAARVKELEAQLQQLQKVPASLNAEQSSARAATSEDDEVTSMADILKPKRRAAH